MENKTEKFSGRFDECYGFYFVGIQMRILGKKTIDSFV